MPERYIQYVCGRGRGSTISSWSLSRLVWLTSIVGIYKLYRYYYIMVIKTSASRAAPWLEFIFISSALALRGFRTGFVLILRALCSLSCEWRRMSFKLHWPTGHWLWSSSRGSALTPYANDIYELDKLQQIPRQLKAPGKRYRKWNWN